MSVADADPFGLVGGVLDGKYDVAAVVAEGGFGVVYRGLHRGLRKPVAIKVLKTPTDLDPALRGAFIEKFANEARLIAALDHPAIVRVLDYGASAMPRGGSAPWMVLDWLEGETLEHALDARRGAGGRTPAEALALLRPLFEALSQAHEGGIAHRDLKPANLMLVRTRQGLQTLRVLDFGIAKVMGEEERDGASGQTATGSRLQAFSLPYAAPEQVSGARTGPWTDVHALGLVLTEILTDADPYPAADLTGLYAAVLAPTRPTPARRGVNVGPWEAVIAKAVAFRPGDRFQSAGQLLAELERSVPVVAGRDPLSEAVTTPRTPALPRVSVTTLRPAEVRSQARPRPTPRTRALVLAAIGPLALGGIVATALSVLGHRETSSIVTPMPDHERRPTSTPPVRPRVSVDVPGASVARVVPTPLVNDAGALAVVPSPTPRAPTGEAIRARHAPRPSPGAPGASSTRPAYIPAE